ncbi:MAG: eukaryotic-like serine/threonine-protein kinase [Actinomycetota bacterium]|nr:eukaryotic-like serine/threonine-protein kinase [Actinomycetota bacterium]
MPDASGHPSKPTGRKPHRWRRILTWSVIGLLVAAGLFGGGTVYGWRLAADRDLTQQAPKQVVVEIPRLGTEDAAAMPDVRGLPLETASGAISDAGIPASIITMIERPAAGQPGLVIAQEPAFGQVNPPSVTLTVSTAARVPGIEGRTEADVTQELQALGVRVTVTRTYSPGFAAGTIMSVEPPVGSPVPEVVALTVAESPAAVFADTLVPIAGTCSTSPARVNGVDLANALTCTAGAEPVDVTFLLNRVVDEVDGQVGIPDTSMPDDGAQVAILLDGREIARVRTSYGTPALFTVKTSGGLRLTFRIRGLGPSVSDGSTVPVVLGGVRFVGGPELPTALASDGN